MHTLKCVPDKINTPYQDTSTNKYSKKIIAAFTNKKCFKPRSTIGLTSLLPPEADPLLCLDIITGAAVKEHRTG